MSAGTGAPVGTGGVAAVDRAARRALVEGRSDLDGIDFVEVLANAPGLPNHVVGAPRQRTVLVHVLNHPVPADWDGARVAITGGVRPDPRVNPVRVEWAYPALAVAGAASGPGGPVSPIADLDGVDAADRALVDVNLPPDGAVRGRVLVVRTSTSGDWSTYLLRLLGDGRTGVPAGFDPPLSEVTFTFTVDCPSDLDCCPPEQEAAAAVSSTVLDYLARDYDALRTRLLDRLSTLVPGWTDRGAADPAVMLIELFASLGDRLASWQDAVAVEAYLGTARQRTSVRRHARLLGYRVHEGCSARAWLALSTDSTLTLRAGTGVCDVSSRDALRPVDADGLGAVVFETCADVAIRPQRNRIAVHTWGDADHVLAEGTTTAFLAYPTAGGDPRLRAGDVLVLVDCPHDGEDGGPAQLGDPAARHAVRLDRDPVAHIDPLAPDRTVLEVHWHAEDALLGPLRASEPGPAGRPATRAVALANVVLADHGATVGWEDLEPAQVLDPARYRPRLARTGLAFADPPDPTGAAACAASALTLPDPRLAVAQLVLDDGRRIWEPRPDLIASGRLAPHVVVEPGPDGSAWLRFGDGVTGRAPAARARFRARYRVGGGCAGNVGAGRITAWLLRPDGSAAVPSGARLEVWNPLRASGGTDPEPLEQVRQLAPSAYRRQLRAVTDADYAGAAQTVPGVQRSLARRRWAGSWYTEEVMVDALAAQADDPSVRAAVLALLETRRMAGRDVEISRPVYAPLHLELLACAAREFERQDVEGRLAAALSARDLGGGRTGFFHPDRFTFGEPLYLSDVVAAAMAVPGVSWVKVRRFGRLDATAAATAAALAAGRVAVQPQEVLRCDSDPNNPEAGRVDLVLGGGS
ncbi:putative baseplate assembly protein [Micromonospora sp. NPDC093277]|uniref:putative baseplate assembly protein n=1 Tax=Micromonospora sp. NPDC093277 TaxID=3364291 RepID=UPI00382CA3B1